ncbi:beta-galactosidase [Domibacillus indicus]|uniref:beta-galactosidase n=1 Tax=Domibacillus indicus TaxID=1437523 RepID=UPI000696179D|nr:beta-galactosidase [Domibacillus indicus]
MNENRVNVNKIALHSIENKIYPTLDHFQGANLNGDHIHFTNYYMMKNDKPYFGICGEFHYSRYHFEKWEDEIIKMKMAGITIIPTYIIWNHHEEIKGQFDWTGSKNLRSFVSLCKKHRIHVIIRIGPFVHGEVRNGGFPDWLYGEPCRVRSNDPRYLQYVKRLYNEIGQQLQGLFFKDNGPIIGIQLENEFYHAGAPWEITAGTSNEWIPTGEDGKDHLLALKKYANEAGMDAPLYTATGWGGAMAPIDAVLPLWGGYAFRPWIFYDDTVKEHPVTPEFIYRDYRQPAYNFEPQYDPSTVPFACCEMGGGMTVFYKYRFQLPYQSIEAMANMKAAGGCNFVGYYVFHGGSNPAGKKTPFLNENAAPKISYDYQAPIGEFGQVRESYKRLKRLHYFFQKFEESFCPTKTVLPYDTSSMDPKDTETLRYAVRVHNGSGYIFINNYQDHLNSSAKENFAFELSLDNETIRVPNKDGLSLAPDASCMLPFNLQMDSVLLKYAAAQLITKVEKEKETSYFFFIPAGMKPEYCFDLKNIQSIILDKGTVEQIEPFVFVKPEEDIVTKISIKSKDGQIIQVYTLTDEQSMNFWKFTWGNKEQVLLTDATLLVDETSIRFESANNCVTFSTIDQLADETLMERFFSSEVEKKGLLTSYTFSQEQRNISLKIEKMDNRRTVVFVDHSQLAGLKEALLQVHYNGDIGYAFMNNELIHDNFHNGAAWEIGLKHLQQELKDQPIYLFISPIKEKKVVKSDSPMAARSEAAAKETAEVNQIKIQPIYEFIF